ncbi:hypothetical protein Avbf_09562 [Armadillidium vulgare]|nr:hypothetical protein Avbf_09562 [Armadillidium vulgare]
MRRIGGFMPTILFSKNISELFRGKKIKEYRAYYWEYIDLNKRLILEQKNSELEADVKILEDKLNLETIVTGRMHAKLKVAKEYPDTIQPITRNI